MVPLPQEAAEEARQYRQVCAGVQVAAYHLVLQGQEYEDSQMQLSRSGADPLTFDTQEGERMEGAKLSAIGPALSKAPCLRIKSVYLTKDTRHNYKTITTCSDH